MKAFDLVNKTRRDLGQRNMLGFTNMNTKVQTLNKLKQIIIIYRLEDDSFITDKLQI
jgi:hypothetical protein